MANNLKRLRESLNLSTRELGTKTSINYGTISRMENGTQQIPESYAIILADFFGVSIDSLLGRKWLDPDKVVYKEKEMTFENCFAQLDKFTNKQLTHIAGAVEYILEKREQGNTNQQIIQNKLDKIQRL